MGIFDWVNNKIEKKLREEFGPEKDENYIDNDEIEKASYSAHSYRKVQKLREKGKYWGLDVPYLQHPVTKQEKPRAYFVTFGILYLLVTLAVMALSVIVVLNYMFPLIGQAIGVSEMFGFGLQPWDIFGIFAVFTSVAPILLWILVIVFAAAIVGINALFISQTVKMFSLTKISMQEMAKGYEVGDILIRFGTIIGITIAAGVAILVLTRETVKPEGIALIVGIMLGVCAVVGTAFGVLLAQRNKAKKQFAELSVGEQQDYIRHNQMLDRVHRSHNKRNKSLISSDKVDF